MGYFCSFTPQQLKKSKLKKKNGKTAWGYHDHMLYCSWDMGHDGCNFYFSFWAIFCPFTPLTAQKMKIKKKMEKLPGDIIILLKCTKNYDQMMFSSWDIVYDRWTDRWTDRLMDEVKKWHTEVGAPPKNSKNLINDWPL